jgi:ubiquinone/menaquinone biosynthesis C-methylase UbiE
MPQEEHFFEFAAYVGLTKHLGGAAASDRLAALCQIGAGSVVLDVGCGVGQTACYLARKYGCRVVGVDILPKMVERSWERAKKEGLRDRVEFRVADAQDLPFDDAAFDAVITESVTAFPEDKQKAVNEYARVTKPGGYIGLNESTWLKVPVPPEIVEWTRQEIGATVEPLTPEAWQGLLEGAGLTEILAMVESIETQEEAKGVVARYGTGAILGTMGRAFQLYLRNPNYRKFLKRIRQSGIAPDNIEEFFGYGIFVGKK